MLKNKYIRVELNTARNALRYLIRLYDIKELYMPYYICPAIRISAIKEGCRLKFYHIDLSFRPLTALPKNAFVLYPNYFGVCSDIVNDLEKEYPNLIVDNAHSFYSQPVGFAMFNSLRKFFPMLRDGSFLYIKNFDVLNLDIDSYDYELKNLSYKELSENENRLNNADIKKISTTTFNYFASINIEEAKEDRLKKFNYWHNRLQKTNLLNIKLSDFCVPFCYPYLAPSKNQADDFVLKLNKQGIDIFRYWNNLPDDFEEKVFYTNLVAIPL